MKKDGLAGRERKTRAPRDRRVPTGTKTGWDRQSAGSCCRWSDNQTEVTPGIMHGSIVLSLFFTSMFFNLLFLNDVTFTEMLHS